MSWGQIDCLRFGSCAIATIENCNPDCLKYTNREIEQLKKVFQKIQKTINETYLR